MKTAAEALAILREGNERYRQSLSDGQSPVRSLNADKSHQAQVPHTIVLGCSDSRVPVEMVFDQSLGEIFVVRVAGNVATPTQIGSIEFAASQFGSRLVVVLGHSACGAVVAAIDRVQSPDITHSPNLQTVLNEIEPEIQSVVMNADDPKTKETQQAAIRANVRASMSNLAESEVLKALIDTEGLTIVGADYDLVTGQVDFFDPGG